MSNSNRFSFRSLSDVGQLLNTVGIVLCFLPLVAYYCIRAAHNYHQQRQAVASPQYFADVPVMVPTLDDLLGETPATDNGIPATIAKSKTTASKSNTPAQPQKRASGQTRQPQKKKTLGGVIAQEMAVS